MSHNELKQTEPQVRMLLNCAWEAIEHVGWDLHSLRNSPTGVFIGAQVPAVSNWRPQHGVTEYSVSGISLAMLANRISYHFNLMGSSATYCTACSTGLSALHAAMNALTCGDCEQALVGAVTYLGSGRMSSSFNLMGDISPEGICHSFDAAANGYMRSEGSFVFAIKPLAAAERDGDPIYAVIEATAVNAAGTADGTVGLAPGRFISAPTRHAQGTQWAGCGRDLYEAHPVFRRTIDAIEEHWRAYSQTSLREACFEVPQAALDECELAQPVIFTLQCALVELLKTWGVYPDCVVGHSSGEVAAAYASGALSLADATRLVFHRATLQQRTAGSGRMLAIGLDRPGVEELLDGMDVPFRLDGNRPVQVEIACENAPANTVICGRESDLQPVMEELDRRSLQNRLIPGNIAFHSRAMDPIKDDVLDALSFLDDRGFDGDVPFVSSVTGVETERLDSAYWWSNIRQPVRFAAAMETVKRDRRPVVVLELAPHLALQPLVAQCTVEDPRRAYAEELMSATNVVDTLAGIHRIDMDEPEEDFMLLMLAFATWIIAVAHHVPAYGRWLADTGSRNAYAHHRRVMQHFTWQRRQREPE